MRGELPQRAQCWIGFGVFGVLLAFLVVAPFLPRHERICALVSALLALLVLIFVVPLVWPSVAAAMRQARDGTGSGSQR